jgi:hypothetical protein
MECHFSPCTGKLPAHSLQMLLGDQGQRGIALGIFLIQMSRSESLFYLHTISIFRVSSSH